LLLAGLNAATTVAADYYRNWAGNARRTGPADEARVAYEHLLAQGTDLEYAHYWLGTLDASEGHDDDALAHWQPAERAAPGTARASAAEAGGLGRRAGTSAALTAARSGLAAEPSDRAARELVDALAKNAAAKGAPAAPPRDDSEDDTP